MEDNKEKKSFCEEECKQDNSLLKDLEEKNKRIKDLESQIAEINSEYVDKLKLKMEQANQMLQEKINEINNSAKKEIFEVKKYALEKDISKLIEIITQFERALSYETQDEKITNYKNGFKMFLVMFKNFLNDVGITEVEIGLGDEFNADFMECVEMVPNNKFKNNEVCEIVTKCYKLHDRIIQVATVKVAENIN